MAKENSGVIATSPNLRSQSLGEGSKAKKRKRIWEIDFLRGFFLTGVLLFHLAYDFSALPYVFYNFYEVAPWDFIKFSAWVSDVIYNPDMIWGVRFFSGGFLVITGISCAFSRNNLVRGLKILAVAYLITLATAILTYLLDTDMFIAFGILHCIGFSLIVVGLIEWVERKVGHRLSAWIVLGLGLAIWALGYWFIYGLGAEDMVLPVEDLTPWGYLRVMFGLEVISGDTFGLVPNAGKILVGVALGRLLYEKNKASLLPRLDGRWGKPLEFMGRHTFAFYILCQPVYILILAAVLLPQGFRIWF